MLCAGVWCVQVRGVRWMVYTFDVWRGVYVCAGEGGGS